VPDNLVRLPDGRCLVRLTGQVDLSVVPDLVTEFEYAVEQVSADLVVDVSGVDFIDSSGLAALVRARKVAEGRGGSLVLTGPSQSIEQLLRLTRLDDFFQIVTTPQGEPGQPTP
jgi:anti-sigma B factor antagonist